MTDSKDVMYWDSVSIIFADKRIRWYPEGFTLDEVLELAKANGYTEGTITVIAENALKGKLYQYDNYGTHEWVEHGTTVGYA